MEMLRRSSSEGGVLYVRIPWDRLLARAFLLSLLLHGLLFLLLLFVRWQPEPPPSREVRSIPIELLSLGWGEGQTPAGGNLSPEGQAVRAKPPRNPLEDAQPKGTSRQRAYASATEGIPRPAPTTPDKALTENAAPASSRAVGTPEGDPTGAGLGRQGSGPGRGLGYGIEWGGGGNRIVLSKVLPTYPPGYNVSGRVRLRFTVRPDGSVASILPVERSDPVLERVAIQALRQWRFNPIESAVEMVGIITFVFELQ